MLNILQVNEVNKVFGFDTLFFKPNGLGSRKDYKDLFRYSYSSDDCYLKINAINGFDKSIIDSYNRQFPKLSKDVVILDDYNVKVNSALGLIGLYSVMSDYFVSKGNYFKERDYAHLYPPYDREIACFSFPSIDEVIKKLYEDNLSVFDDSLHIIISKLKQEADEALFNRPVEKLRLLVGDDFYEEMMNFDEMCNPLRYQSDDVDTLVNKYAKLKYSDSDINVFVYDSDRFGKVLGIETSINNGEVVKKSEVKRVGICNSCIENSFSSDGIKIRHVILDDCESFSIDGLVEIYRNSEDEWSLFGNNPDLFDRGCSILKMANKYAFSESELVSSDNKGEYQKTMEYYSDLPF